MSSLAPGRCGHSGRWRNGGGVGKSRHRELPTVREGHPRKPPRVLAFPQAGIHRFLFCISARTVLVSICGEGGPR